MTCEEYIIERLERTERDCKNIRDMYERNCKRLKDMEDKLIKIANLFDEETSTACNKKFLKAKNLFIWEDDFKEEYRIIKEYMDLRQEDEYDPF